GLNLEELIALHVLDMNLKLNQGRNLLNKLGGCFHHKAWQFFILSLWVFGCQEKSSDPNELAFSKDDVKEYRITAKKKMEAGNILQPTNILYKDGRIVLTEENVDTLIHILDAETLNHITSKGVAGYGPGEIPSIWNLDSGSSDSTFWAYSLEGKAFNDYNLYNSDPLSPQQIRQSEDFFLAVGITWASSSSLMTYQASGEDKYVEYDLKGNRIASYGKWKSMIPGEYPDHVIAEVHQGSIRSSLVNNKIVKASIYRDRIEILDRVDGSIIGINGPLNVIPKFKVLGSSGQEGAVLSDDFIIAFTDISITDQFIFALYSGRSDRELMESGRGKTEIFVFNYQGKPVALLKTDVPLSTLTIDEAGQMLYAITEEEDPTVAVFKLPELD